MILEDSIRVHRVSDVVFDYLATHENHADFIAENDTCEQVTPGPIREGTRLKNTAKMMGRSMVEHFEVTRFEPGVVIEKSSQEGSTFETTDRFEVRADGEWSVVHFVVTGRARGPLERILYVFITQILRRSMRRSLERLKAILETDAVEAKS